MSHEHYEWFVVDASVSVAVLLGSFFLFKLMYRHKDPAKTTRGLGWFLSALTAVPQTVLGTMYAWRFLAAPSYGALDIWSDDRIARMSLTFFGAHLIFDTVLGVLYYPKYFNLLSGWVHHVLYLLLIRVLLQTNSTRALMPGFVEELPTAILAFGNLFPSLRMDLLFGLTFLLTRIVFHALYSFRLCSFFNAFDHPAVLWSCLTCISSMILHILWFYSWCQHLPKYLARSRPRRRKRNR